MSVQTLSFYAASGLGLYICRSGNEYVASASGVITGVPATGTDITDLINAGCTPLAQFGQGTGVCFQEGKLWRQIGAPVSQPEATGADNVLAVFSMPANSFDRIGRGLIILASGGFASQTTGREVKLIWNPSTAVVGSTVGSGGTVVADTGSYTTTGACGWSLQGVVFKYGLPGSNTQVCQATSIRIAATTPAINAPQLATATESGVILLAVTGNATTATADISLNIFDVQGQN